MDSGKRNRNATRSLRLIEEAFVRLVKQGRAEDMTVAMICREADINRSTFYAHYDNIEDLRMKLMQQMTDRIIDYACEHIPLDNNVDLAPVMLELGRYFDRNLPLYRALVVALPTENGMSMRNMALTRMRELSPWELVTFDFVIAAVLGVLHGWAIGEYGDMPIDELSLQLADYVLIRPKWAKVCIPAGRLLRGTEIKSTLDEVVKAHPRSFTSKFASTLPLFLTHEYPVQIRMRDASRHRWCCPIGVSCPSNSRGSYVTRIVGSYSEAIGKVRNR